ncbi:MAG: glutathione peroxidase [Pseudomonadota bacterium]|nr:glutathione peroxidase [Pseudomonadota bacterium]
MAEKNSSVAYDFSFQTIEGANLPLSDLRGKVILVVNTASKCGFTGQYDNLQKVWSKYKSQGLVVLGTPSNDFGGQEPKNEKEIKQFCEVNFNVDFPLTHKIHVKGKDAHPFYKWAATKMGFMAVPRWNFHKYLIDADGKLVDWFSSATSPSSKKVTNAIEALLPSHE